MAMGHTGLTPLEEWLYRETRKCEIIIVFGHYFGYKKRKEKNNMVNALTHGRQVTIAEGIARVSFGACTSRGVVDHGTQGVNAARSGTGVSAFLSYAGLIASAIRVN